MTPKKITTKIQISLSLFLKLPFKISTIANIGKRRSMAIAKKIIRISFVPINANTEFIIYIFNLV